MTEQRRGQGRAGRVGLGPGGWFTVAPGDDEPELFVRFQASDTGRLEITELYFAPGEPITGERLRALSISGLEALANGFATRPRITFRLDAPAPDLRAALLDVMALGGEDGARRRRSARLKIPTTQRKPDSFYQQVAEVYLRLAAEANRPAAELAEANDVPITTVHRWVKEARRRGILPPGQKGRRG